MTGEDEASEIRGPEPRGKHGTHREHLINESSKMYACAIASGSEVAIVLIDSKEDEKRRGGSRDLSIDIDADIGRDARYWQRGSRE